MRIMKMIVGGAGLCSTMKQCLLCAGIALLMMSFPAKGHSFDEVGPKQEEFPYFDERGDVYLGVFHPYVNAQLQVNGSRGLVGTFIDFEKDLGLESGLVTFLGKAMYRIGKHSAFDLTFMEIKRSATKTVDKEIQFGDRNFSANATLDVFVNTQYYLLAYRYSFVRNNYNEFGASIGFNVANISSGLSFASEASGVNISTAAAAGGSKETTFLAPVPLLGLFFSSQVLPKTFIRNTIQYMDVNASGINFKALNYLINLDYNPWKNIGLGVGVYANRIEVQGGTGLEGKFTTNYAGTQFYVRYFY